MNRLGYTIEMLNFGKQINARQYLYFCTSKASKLSSKRLTLTLENR